MFWVSFGSEEQHLSQIDIFSNIINVFILTFDQFKAFLLNKSILYECGADETLNCFECEYHEERAVCVVEREQRGPRESRLEAGHLLSTRTLPGFDRSCGVRRDDNRPSRIDGDVLHGALSRA